MAEVVAAEVPGPEIAGTVDAYTASAHPLPLLPVLTGTVGLGH